MKPAMQRAWEEFDRPASYGGPAGPQPDDIREAFCAGFAAGKGAMLNLHEALMGALQGRGSIVDFLALLGELEPSLGGVTEEVGRSLVRSVLAPRDVPQDVLAWAAKQGKGQPPAEDDGLAITARFPAEEGREPVEVDTQESPERGATLFQVRIDENEREVLEIGGGEDPSVFVRPFGYSAEVCVCPPEEARHDAERGRCLACGFWIEKPPAELLEGE